MMVKSTWDRILSLCWVVYGAAELSRSVYLFIHIRALAHVGAIRDLIGISPFWVLEALFIVGGVGIAFGRKWSWIVTLVLSLLYSAFNAFAARGYVNIWAGHHPPAGEVIRSLLPVAALWVLTIWTAIRFFSRPKPWRSTATT